MHDETLLEVRGVTKRFVKSLDIAATGMLAQQLNVEVISNNIANMNTTGYKRQRAEFQDLLYQDQRRVGSASSDAGTIVPSGVQIGLGVQPAAVYRVIEQGSMTITDNTFDLAINGKGYFTVELPRPTSLCARYHSRNVDAKCAGSNVSALQKDSQVASVS